jgi:hypothetical protein
VKDHVDTYVMRVWRETRDLLGASGGGGLWSPDRKDSDRRCSNAQLEA